MTAVNYLELAILKESLGIPLNDTASDVLLGRTLTTASRSVDKGTGRRPGGFARDESASARVYRPERRLVPQDDGVLLLVDEIASTAGLVVELGSAGSATWTAVTDYETQPDNALADERPITGLLRLAWTVSMRGRVRVTAPWGWPSIPDEVPAATLLQATRLWSRKGSPQGVIGSAEWGAIRVPRLDPDAERLIQHLKLPGIG